jgi:hypothetical protein
MTGRRPLALRKLTAEGVLGFHHRLDLEAAGTTPPNRPPARLATGPIFRFIPATPAAITAPVLICFRRRNHARRPRLLERKPPRRAQCSKMVTAHNLAVG